MTISYLLGRLALIVPTALLASMIVFGIMRVLPGDVAATILSGGGETTHSPEVREALRAELGLNDHLLRQYGGWLWDMVNGNLGGDSLIDNQSIRSQLAPELLAGEGWPGKLYGGLHTLDTPYNAWPSLHVAQSLYLALAMTVWLKREHADARWLLPVLVFLWVDWSALSLSILTTKQHYLWDMVTGAALGLAFWHWHTKPLIDQYDTLDESYFEDPFAQS